MGRGAALLLGVATLLLTGATRDASAQVGGSRNLPVDHWANEYVRRLRVRGYLTNLNPLVQPYRRLEVGQGLAGLDPDGLPYPVSGWVKLLRDELAPEIERLERSRDAAGLEVTAGGRASTGPRLDPLRPTGEADVWPRYTAAAWLETGPFAAETRLAGDVFLTNDPDGLDPGQRRGGRTDNAYVAASFPLGRLVVGRIRNNWGPPGAAALMISDVATPYPQLFFEIGATRLRVRSLLGELDTLLGEKRYIAAHRLDYAVPNLVLSVGEATLFASPRVAPLLRYLNPVEFFFFDQENQPTDATPNLMLDVQLWYRRGPWRVHLEALLDDLDVNPLAGVDPAPPRYAMTIGLGWSPAAAPYAALVEYRQVSSYAYRTTRGVDHYSFLGRGLGENFADHDRLTLSADLYPPIWGLSVSPTAQVLRQGEGDFRAPFPSESVFRASPVLLLGIVETTYRAGLRGRYQPNRFVWIAWDAGENFIRNVGHVLGTNASKFSAVAEFGASLALPLRRRE